MKQAFLFLIQVTLILQQPDVEELMSVTSFRSVLAEKLPAPVAALTEADAILDALNGQLGAAEVKISVHEKEDGDEKVDYYLDEIEIL